MAGNLTKKEQRLADYIEKGGSLNIGDTCRALRTTPRTLLGITLPGLRAKLEASRQDTPHPPKIESPRIAKSALHKKRKVKGYTEFVE